MDKKTRRLSRRTLEIYRELDPIAERAAVQGDAKCQKGCHSCCYMFVTTSLPEGAAIADHVLHRDDSWKPRLADLMKRLFDEVKYLESDEFSETSHFKSKRPCVFLDQKKGTCTIYSVRPAVCRYHYVVSDPELCSPDAGEQKVRMINLRALEERVREEGDRSCRQVGAPYPTLAPLPIAVLWGMTVLEEGAEGFEEKLRPLGRALQVKYWPARMVRLAVEKGMFDLKCSLCEYRKRLDTDDVRSQGGSCPECGDGVLEVQRSEEAERAAREEIAGGDGGA